MTLRVSGGGRIGNEFPGAARVFRLAMGVGFVDLRAQYTWQTWTLGWMVRLVSQVLFFVVVASYAGGPVFMQYALVGNVVAIACFMPLMTGPAVAWERALGTLPLLVASPRSLVPVFCGRGAFHIVQGVVEASLVFAVVLPLTGGSLMWWWLPFGLLAVALGSYGFGVFIASVAVRELQVGNFMASLTFVVLLTVGGVNVPTSSMPGWASALAPALPLFHGLAGTRLLLEDGFSAEVGSLLLREVGVGILWIAIAVLSLKVFTERARRLGSIDLAE